MIVLGPAFSKAHIDALNMATIPIVSPAISFAQRTSHSQSLAADGPIKTDYPLVLRVWLGLVMLSGQGKRQPPLGMTVCLGLVVKDSPSARGQI